MAGEEVEVVAERVVDVDDFAGETIQKGGGHSPFTGCFNSQCGFVKHFPPRTTQSVGVAVTAVAQRGKSAPLKFSQTASRQAMGAGVSFSWG